MTIMIVIITENETVPSMSRVSDYPWNIFSFTHRWVKNGIKIKQIKGGGRGFEQLPSLRRIGLYLENLLTT